jgi:hypothetical protein
MESRTQTTDFFKAGGTLHPNAPSYIKRPADDELYQQLLAGQFCYLLTSRQLGKSSLLIRTAERLRQADFKTAIVDLSGLGTQVSREQWYLGIVKRLAAELGLSVDAEHWWREREVLSPVQCFIDFLHDMVLAELRARIVIFIDEIDITLKLDFTDDFFAAIRLTYNLRATNPEYDRLTFVLLGVAAPTDLIKDRNRTPFNIGRPIDLPEFSRSDAQPLEDGLERIYPGQGQRILDRIFYWTNGHPYLTQKLCREIVEHLGRHWIDERIDQLVEQLFLTEDAHEESNLHFVGSSVKASSDCRLLLRLYRRVYEGQPVLEDERSSLQQRLGLSGLIRGEEGILRVRNEIYRHVFNLAWIKASTPINWTFVVATATVLVAGVALIAAVFILRQQQGQKIASQVAFASEQFRVSSDADVKINYLAAICNLQEDMAAQALFLEQNQSQQLALFEQVQTRDAGDALVIAVRCLYPSVSQTFGKTAQGQALRVAMSCALYRASRPESQQLREQIGYVGQCTTE